MSLLALRAMPPLPVPRGAEGGQAAGQSGGSTPETAAAATSGRAAAKVAQGAEVNLGRRPEPEHVVTGGRRGTEEPAWMVRDTWAMGLRVAIQLCDSCIGRWLRMRPPGDEDEREDDSSAFAAAMAGSRAVDRAWTGMAVREAMMVEPQVP